MMVIWIILLTSDNAQILTPDLSFFSMLNQPEIVTQKGWVEHHFTTFDSISVVFVKKLGENGLDNKDQILAECISMLNSSQVTHFIHINQPAILLTGNGALDPSPGHFVRRHNFQILRFRFGRSGGLDLGMGFVRILRGLRQSTIPALAEGK